MTNNARSLPQAPFDIESSLALACTLPQPNRDGRRVDLNAIVARAISVRELTRGVSFAFPNTDEIAHALLDLVLAERNCCAKFQYTMTFAQDHEPIELCIEANDKLVSALKHLYLGLARAAGINV